MDTAALPTYDGTAQSIDEGLIDATVKACANGKKGKRVFISIRRLADFVKSHGPTVTYDTHRDAFKMLTPTGWLEVKRHPDVGDDEGIMVDFAGEPILRVMLP